jgi:hypothetical protein
MKHSTGETLPKHSMREALAKQDLAVHLVPVTAPPRNRPSNTETGHRTPGLQTGP